MLLRSLHHPRCLVLGRLAICTVLGSYFCLSRDNIMLLVWDKKCLKIGCSVHVVSLIRSKPVRLTIRLCLHVTQPDDMYRLAHEAERCLFGVIHDVASNERCEKKGELSLPKNGYRQNVESIYTLYVLSSPIQDLVMALF
jgi:hypothetical protein